MPGSGRVQQDNPRATIHLHTVRPALRIVVGVLVVVTRVSEDVVEAEIVVEGVTGEVDTVAVFEVVFEVDLVVVARVVVPVRLMVVDVLKVVDFVLETDVVVKRATVDVLLGAAVVTVLVSGAVLDEVSTGITVAVAELVVTSTSVLVEGRRVLVEGAGVLVEATSVLVEGIAIVVDERVEVTTCAVVVVLRVWVLEAVEVVGFCAKVVVLEVRVLVVEMATRVVVLLTVVDRGAVLVLFVVVATFGEPIPAGYPLENTRLVLI
ncbi:hypothetical protein HDU93_003429 [Gonapodya sp. JEL0774]|nr:hypothetical protein HDU93_003429 [Gonapodya sp. JEL0774]